MLMTARPETVMSGIVSLPQGSRRARRGGVGAIAIWKIAPYPPVPWLEHGARPPWQSSPAW